MKECPSCKEKNPDTFRICEKCGAMLDIKSTAKSTAVKTEKTPRNTYNYIPSSTATFGNWFSKIYLILSFVAAVIVFFFGSKDKYGDFKMTFLNFGIAIGIIIFGFIVWFCVKSLTEIAECQAQIRDVTIMKYNRDQ